MDKKKQGVRYVFSKNLKKIRKAKHLSQEAAAALIGVKQNTWSYYELAKSYPEPEIVERIIKVLDIKRDDLFDSLDYISQPDFENNAVAESKHQTPIDENLGILEFLNVLEKNQELRPVLSNKLKTYILELYKDLSDQKEEVIKLHRKYEALRDLIKKEYKLPI